MHCEQVFWVLEGNGKGVDVKLRLLVSVQYRAGGKEVILRFTVRIERLHSTVSS